MAHLQRHAGDLLAGELLLVAASGGMQGGSIGWKLLRGDFSSWTVVAFVHLSHAAYECQQQLPRLSHCVYMAMVWLIKNCVWHYAFVHCEFEVYSRLTGCLDTYCRSVYQKAHVDFFVSAEQFDALLPKLEASKSLSFIASTAAGPVKSNMGQSVNAVSWGVFPGNGNALLPAYIICTQLIWMLHFLSCVGLQLPCYFPFTGLEFQS